MERSKPESGLPEPLNLKTVIHPAKYAKHTKAEAIGLTALFTR